MVVDDTRGQVGTATPVTAGHGRSERDDVARASKLTQPIGNDPTVKAPVSYALVDGSDYGVESQTGRSDTGRQED